MLLYGLFIYLTKTSSNNKYNNNIKTNYENEINQNLDAFDSEDNDDGPIQIL